MFAVFDPSGITQTFRKTEREALDAAATLRELSGETFTVRRVK